jgi:heme/copper-type cytochrome/quinol oxidase subunit 2
LANPEKSDELVDKPSGGKPLSTRRGFIGVLGLGSLSLAGMWAGYGALQAGHGHSGASVSVEEFQRLTGEFIVDNPGPDGSVMPLVKPMDPTMGDMSQMNHHLVSTDVYMMAFKWGFSPNVLRLRTNTPYNFKMMSLDVIHGASINMGTGSFMIRLPNGVVSEHQLTFTEPGEYLVYCSYYCGVGHDEMQAKLIVEEMMM